MRSRIILFAVVLILIIPFGIVVTPADPDALNSDVQNSRAVGARNQQVDDWPMFRHDMQRTGNTSSRAPNTNNILWTNQLPQAQYTWGFCGSPAVDSGILYQGGNRPDIFRAIYTATGEEKWQAPVGGRVTTSPTVANNRVLFTAYDKQVYSLNIADGTQEWSTSVVNYPDSSPTVANGFVYVGDGQGDYVPPVPSFLYCLDELTGVEQWRFAAQGQIVSSPTVVNNVVIFGSYDGYVYAAPTTDLNGDMIIDNSELIWRFNAGARIVSSAAVLDGTVYIGTLDGRLYALPLTDPTPDKQITNNDVKWVFKTNNEIWSSVAVASGRVFVGSHDYNLYALPMKDPNADGVISASEVLWKAKTTNKIWSSPAVAGGKVFVTSQDYNIWAYAEETGALIWNYTMPIQSDPYGSEYQYASPTIVNGKIYIGNYDLTLYSFGSDDTSQPGVTNVFPANNSVNVSLNTDLEVTFNQTLTPQLITASVVSITSSSDDVTKAAVFYNTTLNKLLIDPETDLEPNERYTIRLRSNNLQDSGGNTLDGNGNGVMDNLPADDLIWYFNTSFQVGSRPKLEQVAISPESGFIGTDFELLAVYTDLNGDSPIPANGGYIRVYFDDTLNGVEMEWANDTNIPDASLLDRDHSNGELFRLRTQFASRGTHSFYIECSDGYNTNLSQEIELPLIQNSPPGLEIPTQYVIEEQKYFINLRDFAVDLDDPVEDLVFGEGSEFTEIQDGHILVCQFEGDLNNSYSINVTAGDGENTTSARVLFVVDPVNDAPQFRPGVEALPKLSINEDEVYTFELGDHITDLDTPDEMLSIKTDSAYVTSSGLTMFLLYPHTMSFEKVTVSVSDGVAVFNNVLEVTILQTNDRPVLNIPSMQFVEDVEARVNLGIFIKDEETPPVELEIRASSQELGELDVVSGLWLIISYPDGILEDQINITVIDGNISVSQFVPVSVLGINDPPGLTAPIVVQGTGTEKGTYTFRVWYSDEELKSDNTPKPLVSLFLDGEYYTMELINASLLEPEKRLYGISLDLKAGTHKYLFQCDDGAGEPNSLNFTEMFEFITKDSGTKPSDDEGSTSPVLEISDIRDLRNIFWLIVIMIGIIVLVVINVIMAFRRTRRRKLGKSTAPAVIAEPALSSAALPETGLQAGEPPSTPHTPAASDAAQTPVPDAAAAPEPAEPVDTAADTEPTPEIEASTEPAQTDPTPVDEITVQPQPPSSPHPPSSTLHPPLINADPIRYTKPVQVKPEPDDQPEKGSDEGGGDP